VLTAALNALCLNYSDMTTTADPSPWADAEWAAALLALLGHTLGGAHLRAPPGPVRDYWLERVRDLSGQSVLRKMPATVPEGRLLGGTDLSATLRHGKPIAEMGMLAECDQRIVLAAMAERLPRNTVHHVCTALDEGQVRIARDGITGNAVTRITVIASDEGTDEESLHPALADRLGVTVNLENIGIHDAEDEMFDAADIAQAKTLLPRVAVSAEQYHALSAIGVSLGITSPRPLIAGLKVMRAGAAIAGRVATDDADVSLAVRLCLLPKAQQLPEFSEAEQEEPPPQEDGDEDQAPPRPDQPPPEEDRLLQAAMATLPPGLLEQIQTRAARLRQSSAGASGAQHRHLHRGRPTGVFRGDHRKGGRVNILATLRAAAPWQPLRKRERGPRARVLEIRREDIHLTRFQQRRETLTLFVVDASGSAALQRLAEAKGAVELLLADCYVRRDQVALIAFRDESAELLLPPTRSLVRAKKALAALPGGGATPMAAALDLARETAQRGAKQGLTTHYVLLTDGAANVARDGARNREAGTRDALAAARALAQSAVAGLVIDTAQRPQPRARELADTLKSAYIALPKADARTLNRTIRAATL
jgi:magnesium chelatase subunit D